MGPARIPAIGAEREQKEQHAEQILAFGDPRDRLDIDGMQRKQQGHNQAASAIPGRLGQHPEQQHRIHRVQQQIRFVMPPGVKRKEVVVNGMRQPGQRMPVRRVKGGERPLHRLPIQLLDLGVVHDIRLIVQVDERMLLHRGVDDQSRRHEHGKAQIPRRRRHLWANRVAFGRHLRAAAHTIVIPNSRDVSS